MTDNRLSQVMSKTENVKVTLKYSGADVDDGTMSVEDVVPALQGFSSLYGKLAADLDPSYQHNVRITGVQQGSFEVLLAVWSAVGVNAGNLSGLKDAGDIAKAVLKTAFGLIRMTKHVKQKPFEATPVSGVSNELNIKNSDNVTITMPVTVYNYYQEKTLANDLNKLVKPIEEEKIDSAQIYAEFKDETLTESIDLAEKSYFESSDVVATTTDLTWIQGRINTMTKTTNRGALYLPDGTRVPFKLSGKKPEELYRYFAHEGLVKVHCKVNLDDNLKPISLEVYDIQEVQIRMFDENSDA